MNIHHNFQPLFECCAEPKAYENLSYVIMTGGRNSMKSYCVSLFATWYVMNYGSLLYARYTNSVVSTTIANDLKERIQDFNAEGYFDITERLVTCKNGNQILFKGLKGQTNTTDANNKGINNYKVAVLDEAQDLLDEKAFDRFNLSIRSADPSQKSLVVLVLNPTNKEHWIYKRFFEKREIADGFNGVADDTMYIHTTYLHAVGMGVEVDKKIIKEGNERKEFDADYYNNIFLGYWADTSKTLLFPRTTLRYSKNIPSDFDSTFGYIDIADQGNDYLAFVMGGIKGKDTYIYDVYYTQDGIDTTLPKVIEIIKNNSFTTVQIEANNMGKLYGKMVKDELKESDTQILHKTNTTNKIARIINASYPIKRRFVFKEKSIQDKMYNEFMEHLYKFNTDEKQTNQKDDGADALTGLYQLINYYHYRYETDTEN